MNRRHARFRPCTLVYLALVGLTLITFSIGEAGLSGFEVSLSVLGVALTKGQMVGDYFMKLKGLRGLWRWVIFLWLFIPGSLIAAAFFLSA